MAANDHKLVAGALRRRTVMPNGNGGTDHAWGSQHLVVGGTVVGGDIYGSFPLLTLVNANPLDVTGTGSLIPATSVDQYAATLAQWFGVLQASQPSVFANHRELHCIEPRVRSVA